MKRNKLLFVVVIASTIIMTCFSGCAIEKWQISQKTDNMLSFIITENDTVKIVGYTDTTTISEIEIPDEIEGFPVTEISDFGMFNSESLKKITIGKNVQTIGTWAFTNNQRLKEFAVSPDNEYFVAVNGVLFSKDMKTLLFYPLARNIELNKYGEAKNRTTYSIPEGVETIRSKAFYKCYYAENIIIPDSVNYIGEKAFHRCSALKKIVLPENLKFIGKDAFAYCELIENVVIPEHVEEIQEYAFFNCKGIKEVNLLCDKDKVTLGNKWFPTSNGRQVKECVINWK